MKLKSIIDNNNKIAQATMLYWEKRYPKVIKSGKRYSIYRFDKKIKQKAIVIQMKSN